MENNQHIDFTKLPHQGIQTLSPYIAGKSIAALAKEQGLTDIIKLASNENPRGCSPHVLKSLQHLEKHQIATYPSPETSVLYEKIASQYKISVDRITLGNGSDAIFQLLTVGFALHCNKSILTHDYAFQTYKILANTFGIPFISTPLHSNWEVNVEALVYACTKETALIFLANPNNPTGTSLSIEQIKDLLFNIPKTTLLVLDEAYAEYVAQEGSMDERMALLDRFPNLVITRTFSKGYGLAGLRLGYALSHPDIKKVLQKIALPFTINQAAIIAGVAALEDEAFVAESAKLNRIEMTRIRSALEQRAIVCMPSPANFITFDCKKDGSIIYQALLQQGIIVRPLHAYGLEHFLRVNTGTKAQNTRFLEALFTIMNQ